MTSMRSLALIVVVLCVGAPAALGQEREASYHGRTVSEWVELLEAGAGPDREAALDALRDLAGRGATMDQAVEPLARALADALPASARSAAWTLRLLGPRAAAALPALRALAAHPDDEVRAAGVEALVAVGRDGERDRLLAALGDPAANVRDAACDALRELAPLSRDVVDALIARLDDEHARVRTSAAVALGSAGEVGRAAVPALTRVFEHDPDVDVRRSAHHALERLDPRRRPEPPYPPRPRVQRPPSSLEDLVRALRQGDVRAPYTLTERGRAALPHLLALLDDPAPRVRADAVGAIGAMRDLEVGPQCTGQPEDFEPPSEEEYRAVVPRLVALLSDLDPTVRAASAEALDELGPLAAAAMPRLVDLLHDADRDTRAAAVSALAAIGDVDARGVERLLGLLGSDDVDLREDVAWALSSFAPHRATTAPRLWALAEGDPETRVRFAAICSLLELDEPRPRCVDALVRGVLEGRDSELRGQALHVLRGQGAAAAPALPAILAALADGDPQVRARACEVLGELAVDDPAVTAALLARLEDHEDDVSYAATDALIARQAPEAVPFFARRLAAASDDVDRYGALETLARLGDPALPALQAALERALPEDDLAMVVDAVGELGEVAAAAAPRLVALTAHESPLVRERAVLALGRLDRLDEAGLAALVARLDDPEPGVRCTAARAVGELRVTAAMPALVRALADDDDELRVEAAAALERLGAAAAAATDRLRAALAGGPELARAAALALAALGPVARSARDDLVSLTAAEDPDVRHAALYAVAALDDRIDAALRTLIDELSSDEDHVRQSAAEVLGRAGPRAREAVARLLELVEARAWRVFTALGQIGGDPLVLLPVLIEHLPSSEAADALGALGPVAREAIPALEAAARHDDGDTRFAARRALRRLRAGE